MLSSLIASNVAVLCLTNAQARNVRELLRVKGKQQIPVFDISTKLCKHILLT